MCVVLLMCLIVKNYDAMCEKCFDVDVSKNRECVGRGLLAH